MEFYNERLLPNGLPEIICAFMPYEKYPGAKVICHSRSEGRSWLGTVNDGTAKIQLVPTKIAFHLRGRGTYSFRLWQTFLQVALHEIGHIYTNGQRQAISEAEYDTYGAAWAYVERLADDWAGRAMARILEVDPRMGQPPGALKGYPGILAYHRRAGQFAGAVDPGRIAEWRALKCDAQVTIGDVVSAIEIRVINARMTRSFMSHPDRSWIKGLVHKVADSFGIHRYFISSTNGRHHLMFNAGEACAVADECVAQYGRRFKDLDISQLYRRLGCQTEYHEGEEWEWRQLTRNVISLGLQPPLFPELATNACIPFSKAVMV